MSEYVVESMREVRAHLADVVDRAPLQGTIVTRRGRPAAAVISIDTLRRYQELEEQEINRIIDHRMAQAEPGIPLEVVIAEAIARDQ
ncbi:MAG: type II toxin-antitoxin system Phd/YefM family antitoxin [Bifidobacteriaceae bacterium]|jgi:prevent-host-death family protein|nr:type II toxin-antitoxin system Phd/YefM family antitoxin [Bifidobacteriaceae bacterium]